MNEKCHEMIFDQFHTSGVEEWYCPICGRRFLVQWPPAYKMIILQPGDQDTRHNVSPGRIRKGSLPPTQAGETVLIEEFRLIPWLKWMEEVGFDSRWDRNH